MDRVASWSQRLAFAALLVLPRAAAADDDDGDADVDVDVEKSEQSACQLGKAVGSLETETTRESCGSGGCSQDETIVVYDAKGTALLGIKNQLGDFENPPQFAVDCHDGAVEVKGTGVSVTFAYDVKRRCLALPGAVRKQVESARGAPAKGDKAAARERLAELLEAVVDKPPGPNETAGTPIVGVEYADVQSLWLSVARDKIEAGDWQAGEETLQRHLTAPPALAARVEPQRAALAARLAALRRQSVPIVVTSRRKIGSTLALQYYPLAADLPTGIFWRDESLCIAQEDHKPPTEMRCLNPVTRKWAPREPLKKPRSRGENLRSLSYPEVDRCTGGFVVQKTVPETDKSVCGGAPGEDDDALVAVVDGDALLLESGKGLRVNRGPKKDKSVTWREATALLATSGGTYLAGEGCCRFLTDGKLARLGNPAQSWEIRGELPKGERWIVPPLVSPSQKWAVAISKGEGPAPMLWLLGLKRR
jgi:hypothetical protein